MFGWGESIKPLHGLGIPKVSLQWWEDCNDLTVTSQEWWLGCGELFRIEYIQNDGNMIFQNDVNCGTTQVSHPKMPLFFCIDKLSYDLFFLRISSGWDFASEELPGLPEELPSPKGGRTADAAPLLGLKNCFRGRFGTCACLFYPLETVLNCANHSYRLKWPNFRSMICETMVIHHPFGKCWSPHDAKSLEWSLVRESVAK